MAVRNLLMVVQSILFWVLLMAAQANAGDEGFFDLYIGVTRNNRADVGVSETTSSGTTSAAASIDLSSSTEFGIRFGAWHPTYNWVGRVDTTVRSDRILFGISHRFGKTNSVKEAKP